jgi:hypothetical protein
MSKLVRQVDEKGELNEALRQELQSALAEAWR